jgi:uncharacterized protein (TIRG00374 family)
MSVPAPTPGASGGVAGHRHPSLRRRLVTRGALLLVTLVAIYVVWPSLLAVFASFPRLRTLSPLWFGLMVLLEAVSFASIWALQGLLLGSRQWLLIATSQLGGNAFGRIVPVGAAAGGALQYRMLAAGGVGAAEAASGLTASSLISTAALTAMPVVAIPAIVIGAPAPRGLQQAAWLGGVVFVVFAAAGAALILSDRVLHAIGSFTSLVLRRLPVRRRPGSEADLPERLVAIRDRIVSRLGRRWWEALLAAAGNWAFDYFALLAALTAVGSRPRPSLVVLAYVGAAVLGMIPITPGGLGFVEAGLTGTLTLAGVPAAQAVLATLAYRLVSFWLPILIGPVAIWVHARRFGAAMTNAGPAGGDGAAAAPR